MNSEKNLVVYIHNMCKHYGNGRPIIENLSMNVEKGTIYGLLGSSGCGKSTVLSCIIGLTSWDSGKILVFGKRPGSKDSGIPGKRLGYMPQEFAVCNLLSAYELIQYYGRIYNMTSAEIFEQWNELNTLLELPDNRKYIGKLSGGEKRRTSLAVALLHSPQLLVLDEPTVGLDPLLRIKIWDYLGCLVRTLNCTIIITTHYTEEARLANTIGLLRRGQILVEETPSRLLQIHKCDLLEQAVLEICRESESFNVAAEPHQEKLTNLNGYAFPSGFTETVDPPEETAISKNGQNIHPWASVFQSIQRIYGLTSVLLRMMTRYPPFFILVVLLPVSKSAFSIITIGRMPREIRVGVVNNEETNWTSKCDFNQSSQSSCDITLISCKFIHEMTQENVLVLEPYSTDIEALTQARSGKLTGYITIPDNYSQHVMDFALANQLALNETIEGSRIYVRLDHSEFIRASFAIKYIFKSYLEFVRKMSRKCQMGDYITGKPVILFRKPVYGDNKDDYTSFMVPGILLLDIFGILGIVTALLIIQDRKEGILSRGLVAGITPVDIMISHVTAQGAVIGLQMVILGGILKFVFSYNILGPLWLSWTICFLTGICATVYGIVLGIACSTEAAALFINLFMYQILMCLGGAVWPVEDIMSGFEYISYALPNSLITASLRSVVIRGLELTHPLVWPGLVAVLIWIVAMMICCYLAYRIFY